MPGSRVGRRPPGHFWYPVPSQTRHWPRCPFPMHVGHTAVSLLGRAPTSAAGVTFAVDHTGRPLASVKMSTGPAAVIPSMARTLPSASTTRNSLASTMVGASGTPARPPAAWANTTAATPSAHGPPPSTARFSLSCGRFIEGPLFLGASGRCPAERHPAARPQHSPQIIVFGRFLGNEFSRGLLPSGLGLAHHLMRLPRGDTELVQGRIGHLSARLSSLAVVAERSLSNICALPIDSNLALACPPCRSYRSADGHVNTAPRNRAGQP
jgi:hypothetical protein